MAIFKGVSRLSYRRTGVSRATSPIQGIRTILLFKWQIKTTNIRKIKFHTSIFSPDFNEKLQLRFGNEIVSINKPSKETKCFRGEIRKSGRDTVYFTLYKWLFNRQSPLMDEIFVGWYVIRWIF